MEKTWQKFKCFHEKKKLCFKDKSSIWKRNLWKIIGFFQYFRTFEMFEIFGVDTNNYSLRWIMIFMSYAF